MVLCSNVCVYKWDVFVGVVGCTVQATDIGNFDLIFFYIFHSNHVLFFVFFRGAHVLFKRSRAASRLTCSSPPGRVFAEGRKRDNPHDRQGGNVTETEWNAFERWAFDPMSLSASGMCLFHARPVEVPGALWQWSDAPAPGCSGRGFCDCRWVFMTSSSAGWRSYLTRVECIWWGGGDSMRRCIVYTDVKREMGF